MGVVLMKGGIVRELSMVRRRRSCSLLCALASLREKESMIDCLFISNLFPNPTELGVTPTGMGADGGHENLLCVPAAPALLLFLIYGGET